MKKLMIAAAIVCAAAFAHATSVNWSVSIGWATPDEDKDLVATAYAFDAVTYTLSSVAASLAKGETSVLENAVAFDDLVEGSFAAENTKGTKMIAGDGSEPLEKAKMYVLLIAKGTDNKDYFYTVNYNPVDITQGVEGGRAYFALADDVITGEIGSSSWTAIGAVPEPTSGLLLLIGVAGLALRRRRA